MVDDEKEKTNGFLKCPSEEPDLENITDDAEFALASDAYNAWMEEQDPGAIDLDDL